MKILLPKTIVAAIAAVSLSFYGFSQSGCMPGWQYMTPVTVSNANATALTDFQVKLTVNTATLISQGKMKPDGSDLRFVDGCCTELCYVIDNYINTDTTVVWVKVPSLPATGTAIINMVYGNPNATAGDDPACVFDIYEDFDSGSQSSFTSACGSVTPSFNAGAMTASWSSSGMLLSNAVLPQANRYTVESMVTGATGTWPGLYWVKSVSKKSYALLINTTQARISVTGGGTDYCSGHNWASSVITYSANTGLWSFTWVNTADHRANFPTIGAINSTNNLYALDEDLQLGIGGISSGTGTLTMDWIRVRQWADTPPTATFGSETSPGSIQAQLLNLPATSGFCAGSSVILDAGAGFSTLLWSTGDTTQQTVVSSSGPVTAYAIDQFGCMSEDTVDVVEYALPTVDAGPDQAACLGDTITLDAGAGFASYDWSIGGSNQTLVVYATNDIVLTVFDTNGCEALDTVSVTFTDVAADFTSSVSFWDATFTDASAGGDVYAWDFGDGNTSTAQNPTHTYDTVGTYTVCLTVTDTTLGCTDTFCSDVTIDNAGLSDLNPEFFAVTPNPATDVLVVQSTATETFVYTILDLSGKVLARGAIENGDNTLSVEAFTVGVYILQINNDHAKYTTRIVKK